MLRAFNLQPVTSNYNAEVQAASKFRGGVETEDHKRLKNYVAAHPSVVALPNRAGPGKTEHPLSSGDRVDVFFSYNSIQTAVEVKSRKSPPADIVRGLFQCIKYRAVLLAQIAAQNGDDTADSLLVIEGKLPSDLIGLRNILGVRVVENINPR